MGAQDRRRAPRRRGRGPCRACRYGPPHPRPQGRPARCADRHALDRRAAPQLAAPRRLPLRNVRRARARRASRLPIRLPRGPPAVARRDHAISFRSASPTAPSHSAPSARRARPSDAHRASAPRSHAPPESVPGPVRPKHPGDVIIPSQSARLASSARHAGSPSPAPRRSAGRLVGNNPRSGPTPSDPTS